MRRRRHLWLSGLTAAAVAAAVFVTMRQPHPRSVEDGQPLFPGFEAAVNDVSHVEISSKQGRITLERQAYRHWVVKEMGGYPADLGRLRDVLIGLAKSHLIEAKTARPENHVKLGVDDTSAIRIEAKRGDETLAALLVGNTSDKARQSFVRYPGERQVWLASGALRPFTLPTEYLRQEVLDIQPERIKRLVEHPASGPDVVFTRADPKAEATVTPLPSEVNQAVMYQIKTTLRIAAHLKLIEVVPQSSLTTSLPESVRIETFDGLSVVFRFGNGEKGEYVTIEASANDVASTAVKEEAKAITTRTQGWAYQFAPYLMTQMKLTPAQLTSFNGPVEVK